MKKCIYRRIVIPSVIALTIIFPSCKSTDEIPVDFPETQAYGLTPSEFDVLGLMKHEKEEPAMDEGIIMHAGNTEKNISTAGSEDHSDDVSVIPEEEAEIDEAINGVIFDDTAENNPTVYSDITDKRFSDESDPESSSSIPVHLAGEENDNFTSPNESTIPEYNASGYLAGEGGLNYSQDEFISEGHDGLAWIIPEDMEPTLEEYSDGIYPSVIGEIKAEHEDIWAEKPEHPALMNLRRFLPYILAFLAACAFIALAVFAVKLSSGNLISKKEREKLRKAEEKAAEELQNAPVIQTKTSIVVGSEPSDDSLYKEKVKISEEVETTKGSLIKRGVIRFSELVRMDAVPWNCEETLTALVRQVSLNA